MNNYKEWLKNRYLMPVKLTQKDEFYTAILEIEQNFTGRIDAWLANTFILEASQLLINSIELFELGYFDCAYYSLREAIELSTTMVYLSDLPENEKKEKLTIIFIFLYFFFKVYLLNFTNKPKNI